MRMRPQLRAVRHGHRPIRFGSLGATRPVSRNWGSDRGQPVDRWYIERFLSEAGSDIRGRVIEVKDSTYTERYGRDVTERAILDVDHANRQATHIADLASGDDLPSEAFDCFVLTQTLQLILDVPAALRHAHRILRPGGVLLLTVPVASMVCEPPLTDFWRFTPLAMGRLLEDAFAGGQVEVQGRGNVLTKIAFLEGLAAEDLTEPELEHDDERYPLIVCARAARAA